MLKKENLKIKDEPTRADKIVACAEILKQGTADEEKSALLIAAITRDDKGKCTCGRPDCENGVDCSICILGMDAHEIGHIVFEILESVPAARMVLFHLIEQKMHSSSRSITLDELLSQFMPKRGH